MDYEQKRFTSCNDSPFNFSKKQNVFILAHLFQNFFLQILS